MCIRDRGSIDGDIDENSLEIVKLSMRCELTQDERDSIKDTLSLCNCLLKHYNPTNLEELLSRVIYALEILGHRRYGYRAIRKIEKKCKPPPFDIDGLVEKEKFLLHQYLAVACRLIPQSSNRSFIIHCAKELSHNPNKYATPCSIITQLLEQDKLTVKNHKEFMEEALIKADFSELQLNVYHDTCNRISKFIIQ